MVSCTVCRVTVAASPLKGNTLRQHERSPPQTREVEIGGGTNCLCGFLPSGDEDGEMPGAGMYVSSV